MNSMTFCRTLGELEPAYILQAHAGPAVKKRPWAKWAALAACLCLLTAVWQLLPGSEAPQAGPDTEGGPPHLTLAGQIYYISSYLSVTDRLPAGFEYAGTVQVRGVGECPCFQSPAEPLWLYVRQEVRTDGTVDQSGALTATPPHEAYVRYVAEALRGRDLLCRDGVLYISLWSAETYGDQPDVTAAAYDRVKDRYGLRLEGAAPAGFLPAGNADFSGLDTVPAGALSSNREASAVWYDPADPQVLLAETAWNTAASGQTPHRGFDVYIRYTGPLLP